LRKGVLIYVAMMISVLVAYITKIWLF